MIGNIFLWRIGIAAVLVAWLTIGLTADEAEVPKEQGRAPKATLDRLVDGLKRGDIDDVMACYADSKDVVAIQSYGRKAKGQKELRELYVDTFKEVKFERVELAELSIQQRGDVAWATCRFSADTVRKVERDKWRLEIQTSYVLKRDDDGWKIVLEQSTQLADVPRVRPRD